MQTPSELLYTKDHEWLRLDAQGLATVGITDHAQNTLGDITFVDLPTAGKHFSQHQVFGVVESVKAASDLFLPVAGEIVEVNAALASTPETVNRDPYGAGWMVRLKPANPAELQSLLSAAAYEAIVRG